MPDPNSPEDANSRIQAQLAEYRDRQRSRERGVSPDLRGTREGRPGDSGPVSPSLPDGRRVERMESGGNVGGGSSLLEEMLAAQAGMSDEEVLRALADSDSGTATTNSQSGNIVAQSSGISRTGTSESLPGSFPGSPVSRPASEPPPHSGLANLLINGISSAVNYFFPPSRPSTSTAPQQPSIPSASSAAPPPLRQFPEHEYSQIHPSELDGYRADPHSAYQEYYGYGPIPPRPAPFSFSVGFGGHPFDPFDPYRLPRPNSAPFPFDPSMQGLGDPMAPHFGFGYEHPLRPLRPRPPHPLDLFSILAGPGFGGIPNGPPAAGEQGMGYEELLRLAERMGTGPRGATEGAIGELPRFKYSAPKTGDSAEKGKEAASTSDPAPQTDGEHQTTCPVCLSAFESGEELLVLPKCLHKYHDECGRAALERDRRCPVCRAEI